jgi:hypothetical protein
LSEKIEPVVTVLDRTEHPWEAEHSFPQIFASTRSKNAKGR